MKLSTGWLVAGVLLAFVAWSAGMVSLGKHLSSQEAAVAKSKAAAQDAQNLVTANGQVREAQGALGDVLADRDHQLQQEKTVEKLKNDDLVAGLRAGSTRVSIPVRAHGCPAGPTAAASAASQPAEARAELDPAVAADLAAITREGDDAIRELNATIDDYNAARAALKALARRQQPSPSSQPE